jgi:4-hydroxy-tetrahydrodipicolinate reductase
MKQSAGQNNSQRIERPYRVAQWATGNVGSHALKAIIQHPQMTLAGLYVHSEAKAGRDAGEFCGLASTGIKATRSIDDIIAAKPDCVSYMPQGCNFDDLCRLLESGINVVTTRDEVQNPACMDPAVRERVEAACLRGNASIHATGVSPGFITEAVPLVLASIQRRLDSLRIREFADVSARNSPDMLFNIMGFGRPSIPQANEARAQHLRHAFGPPLQLTANALGLQFDSIESKGEVALARRDTKIAAGTIRAGTVAAMRTVICGMRRGKVLMSMTPIWYCTTDIDTDTDWDLRPDGWSIAVEGDAPFEMDLRFTTPPDLKAAVTPGYTAHRAVNAIPYVCDAPPGIRTIADLPQIIADLREPAHTSG